MLVTCVRCGAPAGAVMSYVYEDRSVRIDDLISTPEPGVGYAMCSSHADHLSPPLGWTLTDHRTVTRLFAPLEVA